MYAREDLAAKFYETLDCIEISFTEQRMELRKFTHRNYDAYLKSPDKITPIKRDYRSSRNLVPNRPLQMAGNNNAVISNNNKRMIQNLLATNHPRDQIDGTYRSMASANSDQVRAFVASELVGGQYHVVYCSYVHDGPRLFYVRLKNQEHHLDRMTNELFNANLSPLSSKVSIGMPCIARYSEDRCLHRAVIHQILSNGCRVTFVDFGHSENVPSSNLFEIHESFLKHKTFAAPFQLAKCNELEPIDDYIKNYFDGMVKGKELELRVIQPTNPQIQQCELYHDDTNVFDMLQSKQKELRTYSDPIPLNTDEVVIIRCSKSAKQFYVARVQDEQALDKMTDMLTMYCRAEFPRPALPAIGECCAAFHDDGWFRAIVKDHISPDQAHVKLVDYGYEVDCPLNKLRSIGQQFIGEPRQAIECCFIEFDEVDDSLVPQSTASTIEMAADTDDQRTRFRAIVQRRLANGVHVIDLRDEVKKVNLAGSIWRLSMPRDKRVLRKYHDDAEKVTRAASNSSRLSVSSSSDQSDVSNMRGCDGAENQEKFVEARSSRERVMSKNQIESDDRQQITRKSNDNGKVRSNDPARPNKQR